MSSVWLWQASSCNFNDLFLLKVSVHLWAHPSSRLKHFPDHLVFLSCQTDLREEKQIIQIILVQTKQSYKSSARTHLLDLEHSKCILLKTYTPYGGKGFCKGLWVMIITQFPSTKTIYYTDDLMEVSSVYIAKCSFSQYTICSVSLLKYYVSLLNDSAGSSCR